MGEMLPETSSHTETSPSERPRVAICVVTYRRPAGLERLLLALDRLAFPGEPPELRVVVIDNDPEESARGVCERVRSRLAASLSYGVEKRRGIPQARNAAIAAAVGGADFVAFIDDDEIPEPGWLAELLRVRAAHGAAVVTGPSLPRFLAKPAAWIEQGGFFARPSRRTGERLREAFTGNLLVSTSVLAATEPLFDEEMALTGGSDVELFRRIAAAGHPIVWADDAVVHECVPASRLTLRWLLQRDFRFGAVTARIDRRNGLSLRSAAVALLHATWCLGKGLVLLPWAAIRGRAAAAWSLDLAAVGAGRLWGLFGLEFYEYRRIHGA
jgi:GT2 family glycosyltransferase